MEISTNLEIKNILAFKLIIDITKYFKIDNLKIAFLSLSKIN